MIKRGAGGIVRLQGEEIAKVEHLKYLDLQSNGDSGKKVKKWIHARRNGWRKVSGVLCHRRVSARMKGKV